MQGSNFVYLKIPRGASMLAPGLRADEQVDEDMRGSGLGLVIGWGGSLGDLGADGVRHLTHHRIDIEVGDPAAARQRLRHLMHELDAPVGTELHYTEQGLPLVDLLAAPGWLLGLPLDALPSVAAGPYSPR